MWLPTLYVLLYTFSCWIFMGPDFVNKFEEKKSVDLPIYFIFIILIYNSCGQIWTTAFWPGLRRWLLLRQIMSHNEINIILRSRVHADANISSVVIFILFKGLFLHFLKMINILFLFCNLDTLMFKNKLKIFHESDTVKSYRYLLAKSPHRK